MTDYISFPKLDWAFPISDTLVQFELFGLDITIKWYGVMIALGFLLAVLYAGRNCKRFDVDGDRMIDVVLVAAVLAFLGARLYYVLFSSEEVRNAYFADPITILYIWEGGLGIYGGIITAFVTGIWMCRLRKVNTLGLFDLAAIGFLIGQGVGRWGNFFNQEAFGGNTDLPWGMSGSAIEQGMHAASGSYDPTLPVHPTFLYESLWCLLGVLVLHLISKKVYRFKGQLFSLYLVWYGTGRFFIEGLRTDSLYLGTMRVSQLVAVVAVLGGVVLYIVLRNRANETRKDLFAEGESTLDIGEESATAAEETAEVPADDVTEQATEEATEEA